MTTANRVGRLRAINTGEDLNGDRFRCTLLCLTVDDTSMKYRFVWLLMKSDSYDIVASIELSHATLQQMHQNLWWAVGYNAIAFPLAAGILYPFVLSPEVAPLSISGSTFVVAVNALMLKRTKPEGIRRQCAIASPLVLTPGMAAS